MNIDVKRRWIEALRSGQYRQGAGYLRATDGTWCCLGVLCAVVGYAVPAADRNALTLAIDDAAYAHGYTVVETLFEGSGATTGDFMRLNDSTTAQHQTFEQIASYIDACLPAA